MVVSGQWQSSSKCTKAALRQYWDAINNDEKYLDLQPQQRGRVDSKLELTQEIERNIAKLNKKTEGRLGIRELAVAYEEEYGIRMPKSTMRRYCFFIGLYLFET